MTTTDVRFNPWQGYDTVNWSTRVNLHRWQSLAPFRGLIRDKVAVRARGYKQLPHMKDRDWNPDRHVLGVVGEIGYALAAGYDPDEVQALSTGADDGSDFDGVDVKCVVLTWDPSWLLYPKLRAEKTSTQQFALCQYDRRANLVRFAGWCFKDDLLGTSPPAELQKNSLCYGLMEGQLWKGLPPNARRYGCDRATPVVAADA